MALIKIDGKAKFTGKTIFDAGFRATDSDAISYIAAVEAADGASLEDSVKQAYENFIVGCKADGIWSALKASCIMAGAKTLNGALVPLAGSSPTNLNFVSADYNRKTGLKGNGTTKYLNANRTNGADPQNSKHMFVHITEAGTKPASGFQSYINGQFNSGLTIQGSAITNHSLYFRANGATNNYIPGPQPTGNYGVNRANSTQVTGTVNGSSYTFNQTSATPGAGASFVFSAGTGQISTSRMSFYSIGESLDLTKLNTRVSALMTAINAAI